MTNLWQAIPFKKKFTIQKDCHVPSCEWFILVWNIYFIFFYKLWLISANSSDKPVLGRISKANMLKSIFRNYRFWHKSIKYPKSSMMTLIMRPAKIHKDLSFNYSCSTSWIFVFGLYPNSNTNTSLQTSKKVSKKESLSKHYQQSTKKVSKKRFFMVQTFLKLQKEPEY